MTLHKPPSTRNLHDRLQHPVPNTVVAAVLGDCRVAMHTEQRNLVADLQVPSRSQMQLLKVRPADSHYAFIVLGAD
mgnify:CR=1 FL=1